MPPVKADFERMRKDLETKLSNQISQHMIALPIGRDGLVISLREAGFYDGGSTSPHPGSMGSINSIATVLRPTPDDVPIEGTQTRFPSTPISLPLTGSSLEHVPLAWPGCLSSVLSSSQDAWLPLDSPSITL
jgi:hypothetical protein